ncbi:hypothetical protein L21SP3_00939 [Sedimentisphaera cyanobacteriorum]|uniref:Uncharacterized protein n=1 Tax=Sedimentisphaera cyanobacteriorum TaxID=1940790 RepID=A0A1Q2HNR1_9BACT|nr:hypothetical protein [Sedimentisphaera cyanobacteriorum]AQQ09139.1 hypothetical protein L21SP3_00939 [Sedimentisphaera cyanobacteriorum]
MKIKLFSFMKTYENLNNPRRLNSKEFDEIMKSSVLDVSENNKEKVYQKVSGKLDEIDRIKSRESAGKSYLRLILASSAAAGILLLAGVFLIYSNSNSPKKSANSYSETEQMNFSTALPEINNFAPETMLEREVENIEKDIRSGIDFLQSCMPQGVNQSNSSTDSET